MRLWSAIVNAALSKSAQQQVKAAGVLRDEEGWYYEESQNFSRSQSTVRIDQHRPGVTRSTRYGLASCVRKVCTRLFEEMRGVEKPMVIFI